MAFIKINRLPRGIFGASEVELVLKKISISAPIKPKTAPEALSQVIFSRIKIAESINTKIGEMVTITEELIGVERLKPLKKNSILMTIPNNAQAIILDQSLR